MARGLSIVVMTSSVVKGFIKTVMSSSASSNSRAPLRTGGEEMVASASIFHTTECKNTIFSSSSMQPSCLVSIQWSLGIKWYLGYYAILREPWEKFYLRYQLIAGLVELAT
ncbi:hypothetical protein ARMGADRAFT_1033985 [Armillaria gallica]|uniref:Uncharacterized protein n=1 Tax=Armillaria gallica TaxID=47427 RepID=A0A2H3DBP5_ARMGA|nr:hypothetical protein ARMGADRAFT_1033985 [Armillaria gallica]